MPSVWSESPLSRLLRWWDGGAASRRPPPMRRGPPAILSQDPGCQRPVLAMGSSSSRGSARVFTCSHPHPIVPVPGLEAPLPQLNGPGSARPPLQPAPCGAADPQRHQQTPGWRGRVAERAEGCSRQDCSLRGTHPFRVSQGPATGPGREGISDKALAKVDAFIRPALNRLWAGGPGRMPGTRPGLARLLCLPLLCPQGLCSTADQVAGGGGRTRPL